VNEGVRYFSAKRTLVSFLSLRELQRTACEKAETLESLMLILLGTIYPDRQGKKPLDLAFFVD